MYLCAVLEQGFLIRTATITSFIATSVKPGEETVGILLHGDSRMLESVREKRKFSVQILRAEDLDVARKSADPRREIGTVDEEWEIVDDMPISRLSPGRLALRFLKTVPFGENELLVAEVIETEVRETELEPLHYGNRSYVHSMDQS